MLDNIRVVHFIGVGGYGMSALAKVLLHMGYQVSGSDLKASRLTRSLEEMGARIFIGHDEKNVKGAELVIYSTAIPSKNPEMQACREEGIPLWHRSDLLAQFINSRFGIAVAGTHGKTTTTSMVSLILEAAGLDPTALVGGEVVNFDGNARFGHSQYLVAEACESDNSFLRYYPTAAILTNIEPDHLEFYQGDFDRLLLSYQEFLRHVKEGGMVVYCADDHQVQTFMDQYRGEKRSYSLKGPADYQADNLQEVKGCYSFQVLENGRVLGDVQLAVPGKHNVYNSLGAIGLARFLGIDMKPIREALSLFKGAKRRFQVLGKAAGVTVVDDYAHHPTEVKATLEAARGYSDGRVIAVFQPHRYTRLNYFMDEFAHSFPLADMVLLHEVYTAGEAPIEGATSGALREKLARETQVPVHHLKTHAEIIALLKDVMQEDDTILFMGAGDISGTAYDFYAEVAGGTRG
jgi:UDP-N-acetylmuramate--alanine ligase